MWLRVWSVFVVRVCCSDVGFGCSLLLFFSWCLCLCCWVVGKFGLMCACRLLMIFGWLVSVFFAQLRY